MASTNKTIHYDLSQYIGSDKPTYLVDYNTDMANIDQGIYDADALAKVNEQNIGNLSNLDTSAKNNLVSAINEINTQVGTNTGDITNLKTRMNNAETNIGDLTNLETTAKANLVVAINEVEEESTLNATNLSTLSTNVGTLSNLDTTDKTSIVNAINEVNEKIETFTELYSNSTGSNQNITMSGSAADYDIIEIQYKTNDGGVGDDRIFEPNNKGFFVQAIRPTSKTNGTVYFKGTEFRFTDNVLEVGNYTEIAFRDGQSPTISGNNQIFITKIIGINY